MKVGIILVGTELLNGDILDTNSQFIQNYLLDYGMDCTLKVVVKDEINAIVNAMKFVEPQVDLLIMSGGLGPTFDDITRDGIAIYYNVPLEIDTKAFKVMERYFITRGISMPDNNLRQVMLPKGCTVVENQVGVAPGFYINKTLALQGVPNELKDGLTRYIAGNYSKSNPKFKYDILLYGVAESVVEDKIIDIIQNYENELEFEILARSYGIILRIVYSNIQESLVNNVTLQIKERVQEWYYGTNNDRLESKVISLLIEKGWTITLAESCTGGLIASAITAISGSSAVFTEGIVTYSNESKMYRLGVQQKTLERFGAVSKECVIEMLNGLKSRVKIAVSGIAGPTGATENKNVGLVWLGIEVNGTQKILEYHFTGDRISIQNRAKNYAFFELIRMIEKDSDEMFLNN